MRETTSPFTDPALDLLCPGGSAAPSVHHQLEIDRRDAQCVPFPLHFL
ncbi:MAG TPA: hypothetical protein VKX16_17740 [Chloroflexota bacterium]|nr:hypothetical protein [Chloroflexota bacterium]